MAGAGVQLSVVEGLEERKWHTHSMKQGEALGVALKVKVCLNGGNVTREGLRK